MANLQKLLDGLAHIDDKGFEEHNFNFKYLEGKTGAVSCF